MSNAENIAENFDWFFLYEKLYLSRCKDIFTLTQRKGEVDIALKLDVLFCANLSDHVEYFLKSFSSSVSHGVNTS